MEKPPHQGLASRIGTQNQFLCRIEINGASKKGLRAYGRNGAKRRIGLQGRSVYPTIIMSHEQTYAINLKNNGLRALQNIFHRDPIGKDHHHLERGLVRTGDIQQTKLTDRVPHL